MPKQKILIPQTIPVICYSLAIIVFICSVQYPVVHVINVLYIVPIMLMARLATTRHILSCAILTLILAIIATGWSVDALPFIAKVVNLSVVLVAILLSTIFTLAYKQDLRNLTARADTQLAILDTAIVPIITLESNQIIQFASSAIETIFGWQPQEIIGKEFATLLAEPFASQYRQYFNDLAVLQLKNPLNVKSEVLAQRKDSTIFACEISIAKIQSQSNSKNFFAIGLRDISERKVFEEKMIWLSNHDELTGLFNRRYFNRQIVIEWNRLMRTKTSLALILLDVDDFKKYNDTLGHMAGDICLQTIANTANTVINRAGDFVARFGGEEFVLVLPNTAADGLIHVANKLHHAINNLTMAHPCSSVGSNITVSIGLTTMIPNQTSSLDALITQADHALYQAKKSGKNCYKLYGKE